MVINPIVGVYIPIIRIPIKGGMTIPKKTRLLTMAHVNLLISQHFGTGTIFSGSHTRATDALKTEILVNSLQKKCVYRISVAWRRVFFLQYFANFWDLNDLDLGT